MVIEIGSELFYQIVYTAAMLIISVIVARTVRRFVLNFAERARIDRHTASPITKLISAGIYIVALVILLGIWGLRGELTGLLAGAGIAGIVIGFATKDILSDLLAGIMLFFDRPFKIGHVININDLWGTVEDIGLRSTKLKTFDGKRVVIPNSNVASSVVTNVSIYTGRRLEVTVGVDYDTDLNRARKAIEKAVGTLEKKGMVKKEPKTRMFLTEFENSSINFKILFWYDPDYADKHDLWFFEIRGELIAQIKKEFDKAGIIIPFPQVTLSERKKA